MSLQQSIRIASPVRVAIVRTRVSEVLSGASQVGRIMSSIGGASPPLRGGEFSFFPFWYRYKTAAPFSTFYRPTFFVLAVWSRNTLVR